MRRLSFILLAVAAMGCSVSSEPVSLDATDANVVGVYGLQFAAGRALPVLAGQTSTQEVDLVADTITIVKDSTWVETSYYLLTAFTDGSTSPAQSVVSGTYAVGPTQINFTMIAGGTATFTGSVTGTTLSVLFNGAKYIYGR